MIDITATNRYHFRDGGKNKNLDYRVVVSNIADHYDVLIFTDSRGTSIGDSIGTEWTSQLLVFLDKYGVTYLFISRPKEITTFFTLINFIHNNEISFDKLISNLGFVDLTPKKESFIDDMLRQNPFDNSIIHKRTICDYKLNTGEIVKLYGLNCSLLATEIAQVLQENFEEIILLGTFEFNANIKIERKRPLEFYNQLKKTNQFIQEICSYDECFLYVDVNLNKSKLDNQLSYDAVHFTQQGHDVIALACLEHLVV